MSFKDYLQEADKADKVVKELKIQGFNIEIQHNPKKGYIAIGKARQIKDKLPKKYYDSVEKAETQATIEIESYFK